MLNFALFYDAVLLFTLTRTDFHSARALKALCSWIVASKLPKILPYFWRHPSDLIYLPGYYAFAYMHTLIKLWALLTFWDVQWSGRNLGSINDAAAQVDDNQERDDPSIPDEGFPTARLRRPLINPVSTPWGDVIPQNLHRTPGNVLQTHQAGNKFLRGRTRTARYYNDPVHDENSSSAFEVQERLAAPSTPVAMGLATGYPTPMSIGETARMFSHAGRSRASTMLASTTISITDTGLHSPSLLDPCRFLWKTPRILYSS